MIRKTVYTTLNETLEGIRLQVIDSIDYCVKDMPRFSSPVKLFDYMKLITSYKNDPPGVELLQSVPTLFDNNFWGVPGAGDCDCFTILMLSMCVANNWNDNEIILVGRDKSKAVHIYSATIVDNKRYILDLTNAFADVERKYKFHQILKV